MSKSNMVIAHGGDISEPSGGTNRITAFAKSLHDNGFDVHLVVPKPNKEFSEDLQGITIHTVPIRELVKTANRVGRALFISLKANKIAKNNEAILQIEHSNLAGFATLVGCSDFILDMHDLCFMSVVNTNLSFSRVAQKFIYDMEKRAVTHASKIIVVSNPMKDFIMKEWDVPKEKIELIPNGYFESKLNNLNFKDVEEVDGMISFLGTLHPHVDINKIIGIAKSFESSEILIIGDGPVQSELKKMIRKYRLKNVKFTGNLEYVEALKLVAKSQVVITPYLASPSLEASCPVKLFDYAAVGKAIVADDVAELCRIFKENDAALVSDPRNQEEFIKNVRILLEDDALRSKIARNAKKLVKDYTWEKQGEKLARMYEAEIW